MDSIWEKMRIEERRVRAAQLGVKVSDLEEMEELQETLDESRQAGNDTSASPALDATESLERTFTSEETGKLSSEVNENMKISPHEEDDDYDSQYFDKGSVLFKIKGKKQAIEATTTSLIPREGGRWHTLPPEVVDRILIILGDIDMIGYLCIASKTTFQPSESVYRYLCAITYPYQTARKTLQVQNWLTWRNMLIHRPRLRTNGFYTLRTKYSKGYCNDAFWEEKQYQSIEVRFYRHMRFFDHGRMLYSLDIVEPTDMARLLAPGLPVTKRIFEGRYVISKREVVVEVPLHYCHMRFEMLLLDGDDGYEGKWNMLRLTSHSSTPLQRPPAGQGHGQGPGHLHGHGQLQQHQSNHHHHHQQLQHHAQNPIHSNAPSMPYLGEHQQALPQLQAPPTAQRVEYSLPVVADLRFHRYWSFSGKQVPVKS